MQLTEIIVEVMTFQIFRKIPMEETLVESVCLEELTKIHRKIF